MGIVQIKDISVTKIDAEATDLMVLQSQSGTTFNIVKADFLKGLASSSGSSSGGTTASKTAKYWRIRNLKKPTGDSGGSQWIVREFTLLDGNQSVISPSAGNASNHSDSALRASDGDYSTWWDGSGQYAINQWLRYEYTIAITPVFVRLWNLNLYGNIPPTLYSLDSSTNDTDWVSVFSFSLTTDDTANLLAIP